jgi:hypothetical protein
VIAPILRAALRYQRENRKLKGELAAVHEVADVMRQRWLEERAAREDLERLHGWLGSEAT